MYFSIMASPRLKKRFNSEFKGLQITQRVLTHVHIFLVPFSYLQR